MPATIDELRIADEPETWVEAGFLVEGDVCSFAGVRVRLVGAGAGKGIVGWSLRGVEGVELDGLPTVTSSRPPVLSGEGSTQSHPNGTTEIDHVVAITPDLDRTATAMRRAGLDLRRIREEPTPAGAPRQAFFRLGGTILEVVQEPAEVVERQGAQRPAFFWGLALVAPDLDATVSWFGDRVSEARPAVQPGRRIATLRRSAGLAVPVALMTPRPASDRGTAR